MDGQPYIKLHKTTGITPNMAMLGREVMLPATLIARPPMEPHRTSGKDVECGPPTLSPEVVLSST